MTLRVRGIIEITPWILGWGPDVEVLRPAPLREAVAIQTRQAAAQYPEVSELKTRQPSRRDLTGCCAVQINKEDSNGKQENHPTRSPTLHRAGLSHRDLAGAWQSIAEMAATGSVRPKPRWWTDCRSGPGTVFICSAAQPTACLVATQEAIVTVVSRDLCAVTRRGRQRSAGRWREGRPRQLEESWRYSWKRQRDGHLRGRRN